MQEKSKSKVKAILDSLVAHANVQGIKGLANSLGKPPSTLYGWIRNGKIFDTGSVLSKYPEIRVEWLVTGEGPMLRRDFPATNAISGNVDSGGVGIVGSTISGKGKVVHQTATIQEGMQLSSEEETLIKLIRRKDKVGDLTFQLIEQVSKM